LYGFFWKQKGQSCLHACVEFYFLWRVFRTNIILIIIKSFNQNISKTILLKVAALFELEHTHNMFDFGDQTVVIRSSNSLPYPLSVSYSNGFF
jgi:hypothetical protein